LAAALSAWFAAACGLSLLPTSAIWAAVTALAAVCFGQSFLPRSHATALNGTLSPADLAGRMAAGAVLTLIVTSISGWAGPEWSGLLAVFPLLSIILSVSSHRAHGAQFVIALFRGMVLGRFSFAAFCLTLSFALPRQRPLIAFAEAALSAMIVQWCTRQATKNARARPGALPIATQD
jgi:hypothetical protein